MNEKKSQWNAETPRLLIVSQPLTTGGGGGKYKTLNND